MKIIDELLFQTISYIEKGMELLMSELLTIEGLIAMIVTFFVASFIIQIRS